MSASFGLFWRFLVEDDPDVDFFLVRDADSVMNIKECAAVEDWLASGKAFHVMRDLPIHAELILAGMWGAHRGNIGNMRQRIVDHVTGGNLQLVGNLVQNSARLADLFERLLAGDRRGERPLGRNL